jgi:uncharacterized phiE125 gp8 family phage protein
VHLRVDHDEDDAYISALIAAATDYLDGAFGVLGRALVTQTWQMGLADWPAASAMVLPVPPVQAVTSVSYFDAGNAPQVLAAENYRLVASESRALIELVDGVGWPESYSRSDAISVTFTAGYGDTADDVPEPIRQAVRLLVAHWYDSARAAVSEGDLVAIPFGVRALTMNYRQARGLV